MNIAQTIHSALSDADLQDILDYACTVVRYHDLSEYILFIQGNPIDHIHQGNHDNSYEEIYNIVREPKDYHFKYISKWMVKVNKREIFHYTSGIPSVAIKDLFDPLPIFVLCNYLKLVKNESNDIPISLLMNNLTKYKQMQKTDNILIYQFVKMMENIDYFGKDVEGNAIRSDLLLFFNAGEFGNIFNNDDYHYGSGALFIVHKKQIVRRPLDFWIELYECLQEIHPSAGYGLEKLWPIIM
jgi:hypothetical protein